MRTRFFVTLLILLIALVMQVKWGNLPALSGAPLVLASLALGGSFLEWDGVLFLALFTVWFMNSQWGVTIEMFLIIVTPCAAWALARFTMPSISRKFIHLRKDLTAPAIAVCAVLALIYISAFSVSTLPSPGMLFAPAFVALVWSILGVYAFEFLE